MTQPTNADEARAARLAAEAKLQEARQSRPVVHGLVGSLARMLEENHFSLRLAEALGLEDDRR
jgi:hypothetical protein